MSLAAAPAPASAPAPGRGPGWLPGAARQGAVDRETLWYDHALGCDEPQPAPWVVRGDVGDPAQPDPLPVSALLATPGRAVPWPQGAWSTARSTPFPRASRPATAAAANPAARLEQLALLALSRVRRDPADPYNDHRAYASPRCVFPVVAAVVQHGEWHALDPDRRLLVATGVDADPDQVGGALALSGRYDRIPSAYGWFRGSLVGIETGIVLRHLAALSRLQGLPLHLQLPGPGWEHSGPARLWRDPSGWSPPVLLTPRSCVPPTGCSSARLTGGHALSAARGTGRTRGIVGLPRAVVQHHDTPEADLLRIYRSHRFARPSGELPDGIADAAPSDDLPSDPPSDDPSVGSWADVLWRRSAGRMPRGLYGFRVGEGALTVHDALALARWGAQPAPTPVSAAAGQMRLHAVVRDVDGLPPGAYDVELGRLTARPTAPDDAAARLATAYLYGTDQLSRNDIARAPLVLLVTCRPRAAVTRSGPSAWTAIQLAAGWLAHGLSLAAAERHLVARPVRALDERDVAAALDLDDDEMVNLAVVVFRHAAHGGLQIDLRS